MKTYIQPEICIISLATHGMLLINSIEVNSTDKVESSSDIGFVKEQKSRNYDVWNEDWSK